MKITDRRFHDEGFTLMELLVAITIVAILVALALPHGASMIERSREIHCVNNMRQFGPAFASYVGDHSGWLPTARKNKVPGMKSRAGYNVSWAIAILPYMVSSPLTFSDGELESYSKIFFRCPSDKGFVAQGDGGWSYGWNNACGNGDDPTLPPYPPPMARITQFTSPALIPVIGEAHHAPSANLNFTFFYSDVSNLTHPPDRPELNAMRHPQFKTTPPPGLGGDGPARRHLLYLDGHVAKSHAPLELMSVPDLVRNGLMN